MADPARPGVPTRGLAAGALLVSLIVAAGTGFDLQYPGRAVATVGFALIVPGWICAAYVRFAERLVEITAAICLSISMGIILALLQVGLHAWNPRLVVSAWAALAAVGAVPHLRQTVPHLRRGASRITIGGFRR